MRRGKTQKKKKEDSALQQRVECMLAINSKCEVVDIFAAKTKGLIIH